MPDASGFRHIRDNATRVETHALAVRDGARARNVGVFHADVARFDILARTRNGEGGCLIWQGFTTPNGYGRVKYSGKTEYVHRVMYELAHGPIPDKLHIYRTCGDKRCVNVDHMYLDKPSREFTYSF